jgi:hypothetical protein
MTPQNQIKAIAELKRYKPYQDGWLNENGSWVSNDMMGLCLTSRDAIVPVIQKLNPVIGNESEYRFVQCLCEAIPGITRKGELNFPEIFHLLIYATPPQLCEALLRATGKWIE